MTLHISPDDFKSIIGALVVIADDGAANLQKQPTPEAAAQMGALYDLIARLMEHIKHGEAPIYRHNATECARMVADLELAKISGVKEKYEINLGEIR